MHWAAEWLVKGYRIETPLGSFAPKLKLKREITDPDEVRDSDVILDGVEYTPGKAWEENLGHWLRDGFRRVEPLFSSEPLNDMTLLEQKLRQLLERRGFVTVESFRVAAGLTYQTDQGTLICSSLLQASGGGMGSRVGQSPLTH